MLDPIIQPSAQRGMSLIELVVALAVLSAAAAGLVLTSSMTATGNVTSHDRIAATSLAIDKMEELTEIPFESLTAGTTTETGLNAGGNAGGIFDRAWVVTDGAIGSVPQKTIAVTVQWPDGQAVAVTTQRVRPSLLTNDFLTAFPTVGMRGWRQTQ